MKSPNVAGRQLLATLRDQLIPRAESGAPLVLLSAPPHVIGSNRVLESPGKALPIKRGEGQAVRVQYWPEHNLNALSVPYFGCVVEGEADIVIGTTTAMCRKLEITGKRWTIQLPQGSFFLLPPGVPISAGHAPHWQRPAPENAYSRIFWMQVHETGSNCHFSTSAKGQLRGHPYSFIQSKQLFPLAHAMLHEMQTRSPQYISIAYHQLGLMLRYMQRSLTMASGEGRTQPEYSLYPSQATDAAIQRAIHFIEENLRDTTLSVERIATHLQFSTVHLNRIFRRELNTSVMTFIIEQRLELGRRLLLESSFNINQIRMHCGYSSSASFIKAFVRRFEMSPSQYRSQFAVNVRSG